MIVAPIRSILLDSAVSEDVGERIFPLIKPEGEPLPVIILQEINHTQDYSLQHISRVQVTVLTETTETEHGYDIAHRIRDSARSALMGYSGIVDSTGIENISHIGDVEMMNDELNQFLIHSDYYVYWS